MCFWDEELVDREEMERGEHKTGRRQRREGGRGFISEAICS